MLDFWGEWHIIKIANVKANTPSAHPKERPPPGAAISERGSFLVLTALQPSVKPLADVVRRYICCDGQDESSNTRHLPHSLPIGKLGGSGRKFIIT